MSVILLVIPLLFPTASGVVDCITSCKRCLQRDSEHAEILEVYCAMCQECKMRRRGLGIQRNLDSQQIIELEEYPEDCPTPPPCESDVEDTNVPFKLVMTTKTTPTTTTTRKPCPPIPPCKKKKHHAPSPPPCMYPCMPMCPCPFTVPVNDPRNWKLTNKSPESSPGDYAYVYVGVPKDILAKSIV